MLSKWSHRFSNATPFLDQGASALFNFLFVLVASLLLGTEQFAHANYGFLAVVFVVNISNALILQPYLRITSKSQTANIKETTKCAVALTLAVGAVASPLLYVVGQGLGMPGGAISSAILVLYASMAYELGRRVNMLRGKWSLNLLYGIALCGLMLLAILAVRPDTASSLLTVVLVAYAILDLPILFFGFSYALRSSSASSAVETGSHMYREFLRFGTLLLGGAIAFWFISGGYLLVVAKLISTYDVAVLRMSQNLMNGLLLAFTALDNYILAGHARRLLEKSTFVYGFLVLVVVLYSVFAYIVFASIYPSMRNAAYLIAIWAVVYLLITFTRLWVSILKWHGDARSVFVGQTSGAVLFLLLVGLAVFLGLRPGAAGVIVCWLLSSLVIFLLMFVSVRSVLRNSEVRL